MAPLNNIGPSSTVSAFPTDQNLVTTVPAANHETKCVIWSTTRLWLEQFALKILYESVIPHHPYRSDDDIQYDQKYI